MVSSRHPRRHLATFTALKAAASAAMITETAQILSTVLGGPYKPTHVSHPCVKWTEDGIDNVAWLLALGDELGNEFLYRRGKLHASSLVINELQRRFLPMLVNIQPPTHFVLAMLEHLRGGALVASPEKAVERYRTYYNECKQGFWRQPSGKWVPATWEKREVPEWFVRAPEPGIPPED